MVVWGILMDERKFPALAEALKNQIQIGVFLLRELDKLEQTVGVERQKDALIESLQGAVTSSTKAVVQGYNDVFDVPQDEGELETMGVNFLRLDTDFQDN